MNRLFIVLALMLSVAVVPVFSAFADEADQVAEEIDTQAQSDPGQVTQKLMDQFKVEEPVISNLRSQQMGYGEIGIALSLAEQMPGGITDENIQKVMDLRQGDGKTGWGNVAKQLDLNLGKTVSQAKKVTGKSVSKPSTVRKATAPKAPRPSRPSKGKK